MDLEQFLGSLGLQLAPVELGLLEGRRILRIRHRGCIPFHRGKLRQAAFRDRRREIRLRMGGEELPRRQSAPLFTHEDHRGKRAKQGDHGGQGQLPAIDLRREPLAVGPVADLIMVVGTDHEAPGRRAPGVDGLPVTAPAEARSGAGVEEALLEDLGERGN